MKKTFFLWGIAGGIIGAAINSVLVVEAWKIGMLAALGISLKASWPAKVWASRFFYGGLYGLVFPLAWRFLPRHWVWRGLLYSLVPTAVQLLVVFPLKGAEVAGLNFGMLTPFAVLVFNGVYGLVLAGICREKAVVPAGKDFPQFAGQGRS